MHIFLYFDHGISDSDVDKILLPFILGWRKVYSNWMRIKQRCYLYPEIKSLFISPCNTKSVIFKQISRIGTSSISCQIAIRITQWVWVTHICVNKLTTIGSDNCLSPGRRQAIIWITAGIKPFGINISQILVEIYTFSFRKMHLKMSSGKWRPLCLDLNVLMLHFRILDGCIVGSVNYINLFTDGIPQGAFYSSLQQS